MQAKIIIEKHVILKGDLYPKYRKKKEKKNAKDKCNFLPIISLEEQFILKKYILNHEILKFYEKFQIVRKKI